MAGRAASALFVGQISFTGVREVAGGVSECSVTGWPAAAPNPPGTPPAGQIPLPRNVWSRGLGRELTAALEFVIELDAVPAPVDAMMLDQPVSDLHDFDDVHLLPVAGLPRVFPGHAAAISQEAHAEALPLRRLAGEYPGHERAQVLSPANDSLAGSEQMADKRALQRRIGLVEGHRRVEIPRTERSVPGLEDMRDRICGVVLLAVHRDLPCCRSTSFSWCGQNVLLGG